MDDIVLEMKNARALGIGLERWLTPPDDDQEPRPRNPFAPPLPDEEG